MFLIQSLLKLLNFDFVELIVALLRSLQVLDVVKGLNFVLIFQRIDLNLLEFLDFIKLVMKSTDFCHKFIDLKFMLFVSDS